MMYRKDIDGLRSIAVLPVLFFHAGFSLFSGGYVGVDIFFVISGFLITNILMRELEENNFSVLNFYQRRARRILPALFSVLFFSSLAAALIIPPELFREYGQSLVSVVLFVSNIFFYLDGGYFGFAAEKLPLLHTWSLAVEEQFYIFVPPLLYLLYRLGRSFLGVVIITLSLLSLSLSQYQLLEQQQGAAFFLIMSRAWELFAGSLIAIYRLDRKQIPAGAAQILSMTGLVLIGAGIFCYQPDTPFPGLAATVPVLGSVLIISFCRPTTWVYRFLSLKPMVWVGLISYSLYLIHQPVFALSRFLFVAEPTALVFSGLILLSMSFAYANYRYIERPFRRPGYYQNRTIFSAGIFGCAVLISSGLAIHLKHGFPERYGSVPLASSIQSSPLRAKCHAKDGSVSAADACQLSGPYAENWAMLSDSHGVELAFELGKLLDVNQIGLVQYSGSFCPPALLHKLVAAGCSQWQQDAVDRILSDNSLSTVVLAFRSSAFIAGRHIKHYPTVPDEDRSVEFEIAALDVTKEQSYQLFWENYQHLITTLRSAGKRVVVLDPLPELPIDIRQLIYPKDLLSKNHHLDLFHTTTMEFYFQRHQFILAQLDTLKYDEKLIRVSPLPVFCNDSFCSAVKHGNALYFDDDHPSLFGARLLAEHLLTELQRAVAN